MEEYSGKEEENAEEDEERWRRLSEEKAIIRGRVGEGINYEAEGRTVNSCSADDWEMASNQNL